MIREHMGTLNMLIIFDQVLIAMEYSFTSCYVSGFFWTLVVPVLVGVPLMASCNHLPPRHLSCKLPDVSNLTLICQRFRSALYSHAQRVQTVMLLLSFETTSVGSDGLTRI